MNEITYLVDLYQKASQDITSSQEQWKSALETMGRFYKRSFDNAVLIHVQNPNAIQVGTAQEWNMRGIERKIKKDARGIAVIDLENPTASLKYYYDILDTVGSLQSFKKVVATVWELSHHDKPTLMERINQKYGSHKESMELCVYQMVTDRLEQHFQSNPLQLQYLNGVNPEEYVQLLRHSIYYCISTRLGLDTSRVNFTGIEQLGNFESFKHLGFTIHGVAQPILHEMSAEITNINRKRSEEYEKKTNRQPNVQSRDRRTPVSKLRDFSGRTNQPSGETRTNLERVPTRTPPPNHQSTGDGGQNQPENRGDGSAARRNEREPDSRPPQTQSTTRNRGHFSARRPHEPDVSQSGRNRPIDHRQLNNQKPSDNSNALLSD
ncbi:MAG: hypothetical protein R3Y07_05990, partial [Eubacteriales bacterium]